MTGPTTPEIVAQLLDGYPTDDPNLMMVAAMTVDAWRAYQQIQGPVAATRFWTLADVLARWTIHRPAGLGIPTPVAVNDWITDAAHRATLTPKD